jgi:hypothetical protein
MQQYENQVEHMEIHGRNVFIMLDTSPNSSPREWHNYGTMVCWHRRHALGDKHAFPSPQDFRKWWDENGGGGTLLPLYLYDHSGITMSTSPFSCQWDSGQVGWIYMTAECQDKYRVSDPVACLTGEVEVYDQYIQGDVYGFSIEDNEGEILDCSWGYIGLDHCREEARHTAEGYARQP